MSKVLDVAESSTTSSSDSEPEAENSTPITNNFRACREAFMRRLRMNVNNKESEINSAPADFFFIDTDGILPDVNKDDSDRQDTSPLNCGEDKAKRQRVNLDVKNKNEVDNMLSKAVLQPDYDQRAVTDVLAKSKTQQKKERKTQRERTAGKGWFDMAASELTDERRRDLEILRMRGALDPRQHYRKMDRNALPKYFQVGRVVEDKADYYSSRLTKKQRKRTIVEELMQDVELVAKTKNKYANIMARKTAAKRRGVSFRHDATTRRSKYKSKAKSH